MGRLLTTLYGGVCYILFNVVFVYMVLFLLEIVVPKTINSGTQGGVAAAVLINLALIAAFGIAHSVMARDSFKRWLTRFLPPAAERSTYVLQSSLFLALIFWQWQPITQQVWSVTGPVAWFFYGVFSSGVFIALWATFLIDHFELFGLRQIWSYQLRRPMPEPEFRTPALYQFVRHPLQSGMILMFFATPHMTVGHLLLALAMTLYILIGLYYEERSLVGQFGERYRSYRERVPMLIPGLTSRQDREIA